ncbi:MAG: hypothetical protein Q9162_003769 [Coniocarpon cinnabarinum]
MDDPSQAKYVVTVAIEKWGRLDGVIVNHGTLDPAERIQNASIESFQKSLDVNVLSALALVKAGLEPLRKSKGAIIFTSSGAAVKGMATWGAYGASKAVLNSLARTLAAEEQEITTLAIRPGVVETAMQDTIRDEHFSKMDKQDVERFTSLREKGEMLRPEQPGSVMARLALRPPIELSGEFVK